MKDWFGSQAEVGKKQKTPSSQRVGLVILTEVQEI